MNACPATSFSALRRAAVVALLLVFVLAQTLGWIHRGLHGGGAAGEQAVPHLHASSEHSHHDVFAGLFGSHGDTSDCRLFDVLAQPGCAAAPLVLTPLSVPAAVLVAAQGDFVARWSALFDARGPPAPR